ncbi:PH domain-containing protein [Companilactobacillus futsaii]|uniref:PH domain-containing protein n=2 Tax=Companilactobacillus futsaii TaxID=938155 RepID=A0A5B7T3A4_9LACO|nr:PH domain-containing protein [Companilactobacillus futsaii]KRK99332.1 superfamily I DNA RNA helicase [Companilactobacillus futsaii JCM 17355]QCX25039.1 PH domain-containing protein [Companilactobacillus futsaii]
MSLLDGLLGNATNVDRDAIKKELKDVLIPNEEVDLAFKLVRDLVVFTNHRLIVVDKQGVTGKKVDYKTFPYKSISRFSVETTGHFDLDAELKIWISGAVEPAQVLQFRKDNSITTIQKALATAILL